MTASSSGAVRVRCLAQGLLDTGKPGIELEPLRLPASPLYLRSHTPPDNKCVVKELNTSQKAHVLVAFKKDILMAQQLKPCRDVQESKILTMYKITNTLAMG